MDNTGNVSRIAQHLGNFGRRAASWLADSVSRSGEGQAVIWRSFAQQHQPHSMLQMSGRDRSDLRLMKANHQFGPADL